MHTPIPFQFGVDYYPEHWPESRWATDARMMREFGVDVVRLGEFSWFKMEPEQGRFDFAWLERAIDVLSAEGIKVILGTPTAAPPAWIVAQDEELQPIDSRGLRHGFGGRHHDCQSNPSYREHIRRFVTAYARRFGQHPAVIGWQVDNELGNSHGDLCHCHHCRARFQQWLQAKYGTIDELNRRWGTAFWSQGYQSFEQIPTPMMTASGQNPSHALDWKRFCSDLVLDFHEFQARIIRELSPGRFITHNCMGFSDKFSYFDLGEQLDFMAHDQYPGGHFLPVSKQNALRDEELAAELAFIRCTKNRSFFIMEQQSSITGWETLGRAPQPGQLALWSMQSVAHGADAIVYFRWRSCAMGTEQYWHGLLPHSGIPGRSYRELSQFAARTKPLLARLNGAMPPREAAILYDYDENYAITIQPHHPEMRYVDHLLTYYRALHAANIPTDFAPYARPWEDYRLVLAPLYYLTSPDVNERMRQYVADGGTLVLDMRAGVKDMDNLCLTDCPLPMGLSELAGVEVDEYDCLLDDANSVSWDGESYPVRRWCDVMRATTAEPLAAFERNFFAGQPAVTRNRYGKGAVYYVGAEMSPALAQRLARELVQASGVCSLGATARGVELVCRDTAERRYVFALNHTGEPQAAPVGEGWRLVTEGEPGKLPPYGYQVFECEA